MCDINLSAKDSRFSLSYLMSNHDITSRLAWIFISFISLSEPLLSKF